MVLYSGVYGISLSSETQGGYSITLMCLPRTMQFWSQEAWTGLDWTGLLFTYSIGVCICSTECIFAYTGGFSPTPDKIAAQASAAYIHIVTPSRTVLLPSSGIIGSYTNVESRYPMDIDIFCKKVRFEGILSLRYCVEVIQLAMAFIQANGGAKKMNKKKKKHYIGLIARLHSARVASYTYLYAFLISRDSVYILAGWFISYGIEG